MAAKYFSYHNPQYPQIDFCGEYIDMGTGYLEGWTHYRRIDNGEECYMKMEPDMVSWSDDISSVKPQETPQSPVIDSVNNHQSTNKMMDSDDDIETISDIIKQMQQVGKPQEKPKTKRRKKKVVTVTPEEDDHKAQSLKIKSQSEKKDSQEQWLNIFATVAAVVIVLGVAFFGAGALAFLAFAGAGGMIAKA